MNDGPTKLHWLALFGTYMGQNKPLQVYSDGNGSMSPVLNSTIQKSARHWHRTWIKIFTTGHAHILWIWRFAWCVQCTLHHFLTQAIDHLPASAHLDSQERAPYHLHDKSTGGCFSVKRTRPVGCPVSAGSWSFGL